MKIAYFGTGEFSKNILEKLTNLDQIKIKLIVSQPDKAKGRYKNIIKTPVKELGEKLGIEVLQPEKINTEILLEKINLLGLDFIIVVAYGKIIPKKILDAPKYMSINIHGSLLPKYRGASPIQEALINGDTKTGLTLIKMNEKMDEGDIISAKEINIDILDTSKSIFTRFEEIGPQLLIDSLNKIKSGNIKTIPQNNKKCKLLHKNSKEGLKNLFLKRKFRKNI